MAKFKIDILKPCPGSIKIKLSDRSAEMKNRLGKNIYGSGDAMVVRWRTLEMIKQIPNIEVPKLCEKLFMDPSPKKFVPQEKLEKLCSRLEKLSLKHLSEINKLLSPLNLKIEATAKDKFCLTTRGRLVLMSGPSGVGKQMIEDRYFDREFERFVFYNTRKIRKKEATGINYHFINRDEYEQLRSKVPAVATYEVHGQNPQLVHSRLLDLVVDEGRNIFAEVDSNLAGQILKKVKEEYPGLNVTYIALLAPNEEERADRLISRTEKDYPNDFESMEPTIRKRIESGTQNISQMALLGAVPVISDIVKNAVAEIKTIVGAEPYLDALSAAKDKNYAGIISGRRTIDAYKKLIEASDNSPLDPRSVVLSLAGKEDFVDFLKKEIARLKNVPVEQIITNIFMSYIAKKTRKTMSAAIQAGTVSPFHYGHMALALTGVLGGSPHFLEPAMNIREEANAVILMPGGLTPDKPFALAAEHRIKLVKKAIKDTGLGQRILTSNLREEMAKALEGTDLRSKNPDHQRRIVDLAAFCFLISMNPQIDWKYYLVGSDKLINYGPAKNDEKSLVEGIIKPSGMKLLFTPRSPEETEENIKAQIKQIEGDKGWWWDLLQGHPEFIVKNSLPTSPISANELRGKAVKRDPLWEYVTPSLIKYIYQARAVRGGKGERRILDAFELENRTKTLEENMIAQAKTGKSPSELQDIFNSELSAINEEKLLLWKMHILADGKKLTINKKGELVT